jgi:glycosyltransferase involved in cell wall biosynthesis
MKLAVLLITYNQAPYIRRAIESVLVQKTDFDFELFISDDCSTDGTREIVLEYARKYPDRIRLRLNAVNQNSNQDFEQALFSTNGEYIALLEGDDYWISHLKLQKMVDILDANPACTMIWHDMEHVNEFGKKIGDSEAIAQSKFTLIDFLYICPISTVGAVVIRSNSIRPQLPSWYSTNPVGDYPLWIACVRHGYALHVNQKLGAYRIHAKGVWNGLSNIEKAELALASYRDLLIQVDDDWRVHMIQRMARYWEAYALEFKNAGRLDECREMAKQGLLDCPNNPRLLLLGYAPQAWNSVRRIYKFTQRLFFPQMRQTILKEQTDLIDR